MIANNSSLRFTKFSSFKRACFSLELDLNESIASLAFSTQTTQLPHNRCLMANDPAAMATSVQATKTTTKLIGISFCLLWKCSFLYFAIMASSIGLMGCHEPLKEATMRGLYGADTFFPSDWSFSENTKKILSFPVRDRHYSFCIIIDADILRGCFGGLARDFPEIMLAISFSYDKAQYVKLIWWLQCNQLGYSRSIGIPFSFCQCWKARNT